MKRMTSTISDIRRWTRDQEKAALAPIGPVLVVGAAGTGKTVTIAARMVALVQHGVSPEMIVCWTHAADGGDHIRTVMGAFLPPTGLPSSIGTPQALALDLLRFRGMEVLRRSPNFTIWQQQEAQQFVADFLLEADGRDRRGKLTQAARILRFHWLRQSGYHEEQIFPRDPAWPDVVRRYEDIKEQCNAVDQGDLVPLINEAMTNDGDFREQFAQVLCPHILVDDLNRLTPVEYRMARLLTGPEQSITVTINPNAGLRSIDGASNGILDVFRIHYPECKGATFSLQMNMRATHDLGKGVQALTADPTMNHLVEQKTVVFRTDFKVGQKARLGVPPALIEFEGSPVDMCRDIMGRSIGLFRQGYRFEDLAFIYQDVSMLEHLRVLALDLGVSYKVLDDEVRAWDLDTRRITALLETVLNDRDVGAFRIAVCVDPRHDPQLVDTGVTKQLMTMLAERGINLGQAARRYCANPLIDADLRRGLQAVADAWYHLSEMLHDPSVHVNDLCLQAVAHFEDILGPFHPLRERPQVKELLTLAELEADRPRPANSKHAPRDELRVFLDRISPGIQVDPLDLERTDPGLGMGVTFASVDATQGLEWPVVWVVGVSDHILPGDIPRGDVGRMREAQRRFLVWSSRAKDLLFYCHAIMSGPTREARPSRFLQPIGSLLRREVVPSRDLGRPSRPFPPSSATGLRIETSTSHPGIRTRHDQAVRQR